MAIGYRNDEDRKIAEAIASGSWESSSGGAGGTGGSGGNPNSYSGAQNTGTSDATRGVMDSFINNTYNPYGNNDDFTQYYAETNGSPAPWTAAGIPESARVGMIQEAMGKDEGWATHVDEENAKRASDMDAMVQHVYDLVQSGDITKAQAGELLGWMDENAWANPDSYGGENYDVLGMYGDMLEKGRQEDANNRGFGTGNAQDDRVNFINNSALDLAERILAEGSTITADDAYAEIAKAQEENGLSDQELELYYKALNEGLTAGGFGTLDPSKTPAANATPTNQRDALTADLDSYNETLETSTGIIRDMMRDVASELIASGKYPSVTIDMFDGDFDVHNPTKDIKDPKFRAAFNGKIDDLQANEGGEFKTTWDAMTEDEENVKTTEDKITAYDNDTKNEETLNAIDLANQTSENVAEDLRSLEQRNSALYQRIVNEYVDYLEESDPEKAAQFTSSFNRNEFTGDYEVPASSLEKNSDFMLWYDNRDNPVWERYNVDSDAVVPTQGERLPSRKTVRNAKRWARVNGFEEGTPEFDEFVDKYINARFGDHVKMAFLGSGGNV